MRFYLLTALIFAALPAFAQRDIQDPYYHIPSGGRQAGDRNGPEVCRPDSLLRYSYLSPGDSMLIGKTAWRYYGADATVRFVYGGTPLKVDYVDSTVFDAPGRPVFKEALSFDAAANQFMLSTRMLLYPHGNTTQNDSVINFKVNFSGIFGPSLKTVYTYDADDLLTEQQHFLWDPSGEIWKPGSRIIYSRTPTGKVSRDSTVTWDGTVWSPIDLNVYAYDSNDSLLQRITYNWVFGFSQILSKTDYTYDQAAHWSLRENYMWSGGDWVYSSYYLDDWDDQGRYERNEYFLVNIAAGRRTAYFYAGSGTCTWFTSIDESDDGENWDFAQKAYYFPVPVIATHGPGDPGLQWRAYPNPADGWLWLEAPAGSPVRLTDLQGRTLYSGVAKGKERLDLRGVQGACVLIIGAGERSSTRLIMNGR